MEMSECSSLQGPSRTSSPRVRKRLPPADDITSCSTSGNEGDQKLLRQFEAEMILGPPVFYLERRVALISWLQELQGELGISSMSVHSCVLLMDRFASSVSVPQSLLQLLLVACLYIAGWCPFLFYPGLL